jgi:hypothetical protein
MHDLDPMANEEVGYFYRKPPARDLCLALFFCRTPLPLTPMPNPTQPASPTLIPSPSRSSMRRLSFVAPCAAAPSSRPSAAPRAVVQRSGEAGRRTAIHGLGSSSDCARLVIHGPSEEHCVHGVQARELQEGLVTMEFVVCCRRQH